MFGLHGAGAAFEFAFVFGDDRDGSLALCEGGLDLVIGCRAIGVCILDLFEERQDGFGRACLAVFEYVGFFGFANEDTDCVEGGRSGCSWRKRSGVWCEGVDRCG